MAVSFTIQHAQYRHDSPNPQYILSSYSETKAWLKIADWNYFPITSSFMAIEFLNRSMRECPIVMKGFNEVSLTTSASATQALNSPSGTGRSLTASAGTYEGGYYSTPLSSTFASVQGRIYENDNSECGISLQNSNTTPTHEYSSGGAHTMLAQDYGDGTGQVTIRENGVIVASHAYHRYQERQTMMIELEDGIVRYWLIGMFKGTVEADAPGVGSQMRLLRTTRSKLTTTPLAQVTVTNNAKVDNILVCNNIKTTRTFESVGVLEGFQDWFNDYSIASTAEAIEMADNNPQFTFPGHKKRRKSLSANLNVRTADERAGYVRFFDFHGIEEEFIFVDNARAGEDGLKDEFWARFASPFGDKMRASCLSAHNAVILESYRNDYIPKIQ